MIAPSLRAWTTKDPNEFRCHAVVQEQGVETIDEKFSARDNFTLAAGYAPPVEIDAGEETDAGDVDAHDSGT